MDGAWRGRELVDLQVTVHRQVTPSFIHGLRTTSGGGEGVAKTG